MQKLILIALLGLVFIAITGAETEENSFDVIETEALEVRRVRAPKKNDEDKDNQKTIPKKKNRQAKQGKGNGKEGGNGNSKDNDNDNDRKKNPGRVAKKKGRQAKKNQEKKGDKKADRREKKNNNKSNGSGKDKNSNKKGRGKKQRGRNLKQKQGKNGGKDKDKNEGKEKGRKEGKKNGKNGKNKTKVRTIKKTPAGVDRQTTCPVTDACVSTAVSYLKIVQNQVANFKKQKARIERQITTGTRKNDKKDVFAAANNRLVDFAGGNKTAPKCGSLTDGTGVDNIKNLTNTLSKCSDSIKAACDISALPQPNTTFVDDCTIKTDAFETGVEECRSKSGADACTCWTKATLGADVETIKKCTLVTEAKAMATAVTACKSAFSECRKYEDEVAGAIYSCSVSTDGLKSKLKSLAANADAVTKAKDKINAIINGRQMVSRQAPAASCAEIISIAAKLLTLIEQAPASPKVAELALSISTSTATCSADEKTTLKESASSFETVLASISAEVSAAQATLLAITGSTASASVIQAAASCTTDTCSAPLLADSTVAPATTTPAPTTTKAPTARRRRLVVEDILKSKLL